MKREPNDIRTLILRGLLLDCIRTAQEQLKRIRDGIRELSSANGAVTDRTDDICREVDLAAVTGQSTAITERLTAASEALLLLESGDELYGVCEDCQNEISEVRLRVIPFAKRCLPCQERSEEGSFAGAHHTFGVIPA
jgi:DnaK suppressor protein